MYIEGIKKFQAATFELKFRNLLNSCFFRFVRTQTDENLEIWISDCKFWDETAVVLASSAEILAIINYSS